MKTSFRIILMFLAITASRGVVRAEQTEPSTSGQRLLGICQTLLGEDSSFCEVVTDWSIEKTVDVPLAEQPSQQAVAYTIRVTEGQSRYLLGMTSIVELDGLIPEGTRVLGAILSLQKADPNDPNFDENDPLSAPRHTTVASAIVGAADPACGCPYVSQSAGGGLSVGLRDEFGNPMEPGEDTLVDYLAEGEKVVVQFDAVYDLSAGVVLPGDSVRIQACVQYVPADEEVSSCFEGGGTVRSVRACRTFDFASYAQPEAAKVELVEVLGAASDSWITLAGFKARSLSPLVTPNGTLVPVTPGGPPVSFEIAASGNPGTESIVTVKGDISCAEIVDCGDETQCTGSLGNAARLDYGDSRPDQTSEVSTTVICAAHLCTPTEVASCDDGDQCTTDTCVIGVGCQNTVHTGSCNDGNACTVEERCIDGVCAGGVAGQACIDDGNPCTDEVCDQQLGCMRTIKPNRSRCDDGNACTVDDLCIAGQCNSGGLKSCDDGNPCTTDTCGANGQCVNTPFAGAPGSCDDGNICTVGDRCNNGSCSAGSPRVCNSDNNACTSDTCIAGQGCVYAPLPNNTECSDNNACTMTDKCVGGACVPGTARNCDDSNQCTNDGCNAEIGCFNAPRTGSCTDSTVCTTASACSNGACVGTAFLNCDDGNPCTVDSCDPVTGCRNVNIANGSACNDGDACTTGETCQSGACVPQSAVTCDDGNQCTNSTCVPETGCVHVPRTGACVDSNLCTGPDTCSGSSCVGGPQIVCDDNNPCTRDTCDPAVGCKFEPLSAGSCDDKNLCTGDGTCSNGTCQPGAPISCDDNNPCTAGSCDSTQGCVQIPVSGSCDDGDPCTGAGTCQLGSCVPGTAITCADSNDCTADFCKAGVGCQFVPRTDVPCNDGNACTINDTCVSGQCKSGTPLNCDDGNPCTLDLCTASGCSNTALAPGAGCSDNNPCTVNDVCSAGSCIPGAPRVCDDGNSCTDDVCSVGAGGCVSTTSANGQVCNDGDACSGCPWPETPVTRGFKVFDPTPDPAYFPTRVPSSIELDGFLGAGSGKAYFNATANTRLVMLSSTNAVLRGELSVATDSIGRAGTETWTVSLSLTFRGVGRAGQGATPYYELSTSVQSTAFTDGWEYWTLGSGAQLTRAAPSADTATLSADTSLQSLPFQLGLRASGSNLEYGAAMPVRWTRGTRSGTGVIRLGLDQVFCQNADQCSNGSCLGGTEAPICRDLAVGDYCTYDAAQFGTACSGVPTQAGCILSSNFSKLQLERTACGVSPRGVAFGFTGFRRWGFTSATRVDVFMPPTGNASGAVDLCNPSATSATAYVGRAFALDLSILLSDVGGLPAPGGVPFGDLVRTTGPCAGLSLREISRRAEAVASGSPTGFDTCNTLTVLDTEITAIVNGFKNCAGVAEGVTLPQ